MNTLRMLCLILLGAVLASANTPNGSGASSVNWEKAERHYIANLQSENSGVVTSAANFIRKYKLSGGTEELIGLLAKDQPENVKMSAALTLLNVGGAEGRTAVEEALKNEENELVAEFYRTMLRSYVTAGN